MAFVARAGGILRRRAKGHALQIRTMANATVQLPDLPYDYSSLEPVIDREIMEIHHKKHHQTYVTNYNKALGDYHQADEAGDVKKLVTLQSAINFNGGGHINHSIFWKNLTPVKEYQDPEGDLKSAIDSNFGSLDAFKSKFNQEAAGVQGSGWGWLGYNPTNGALEVATTPNQDILEKQTGLVPLLGVDVWEHAYYLQYKNARPEYLKNIWKVINWTDVAERYAAAKE